MFVRAALVRVALAALATSAALTAQSDPSSPQTDPFSDSIHGRVVADEGGSRRRTVFDALEGSDRPPVATDGDGMFTLAKDGQEAGTLSVWKTGYELAHVRLGDGIEIRLHRGAVITGWVRDNVGEPLSSVL